MQVEATYTRKDKEGNAILGEDGKAITRAYSCEYNFGENLIEFMSVADAGTRDLILTLTDKERKMLETICLSPGGFKAFYNSRSRVVVALQGNERGWLEEDLSDTEIDAKVSGWEIPEGAPRMKDPLAKAAAALSNLTNAQVQKLLRDRGLAA